MKSHTEIVHEGIKSGVKCHLCDKTVATTTVLRRHIEAVHEKKRPFSCNLCDFTFTQKAHLITHLKGKHKQTVVVNWQGNKSYALLCIRQQGATLAYY